MIALTDLLTAEEAIEAVVKVRPRADQAARTCKTCAVGLFPEETEFCSGHAESRIDNTGAVEDFT